jgi:hypothetical protein
MLLLLLLLLLLTVAHHTHAPAAPRAKSVLHWEAVPWTHPADFVSLGITSELTCISLSN